ncbi:efflux RND transporter periplasmic adaptor subunit [Photobacterium atrarenae]|uniref:Efflux RND transporter periplasmic adaptor subunit n=1 Tax=Photobacterium atrarenae TaxID=865757 RepID=A0ABY5GLX2_9GAMM|nr:efflux RND transporter periplasmic adaptor subunit [Photobacterium atrarenae]
MKPVGEVEVGSEVSGRIIELLVDFNDVVHRDQIIARLDPEFFAAQLRQAEAALHDAKATVDVRKATLRQATRSLDRVKTLNKRSAASVNTLDEAETDVWIARAELKRAEAVVRNQEAALEEARIALERTAIRAPIDGVVISREVMRGQTVAASLEAPKLFKIARTLTEMEIHARIDEADIGLIRIGQLAVFTVPAYGERQFEARITQIRVAPIIVDNVVTYTVVLLAENPGESLLPGMTAIVEINAGEETMAAPAMTLQAAPDGTNNHAPGIREAMLHKARPTRPLASDDS